VAVATPKAQFELTSDRSCAVTLLTTTERPIKILNVLTEGATEYLTEREPQISHQRIPTCDLADHGGIVDYGPSWQF
jgi:hypothetical protein